MKLCGCGCGKPVRWSKCTYATPQCVPAALRSTGGAKGRASYAKQQREQKFGALWELSQQAGVTREMFFAAAQKIAEQFWAAGYSTCYQRARRQRGVANGEVSECDSCDA